MSNGFPQSNDLISAFHDGELAEHDRKAAEQFLEESADSRAELEDYRALSDLLRELPPVSAPAGLRAAVMRRIVPQAPVSATQAIVSRPKRTWRFKIGLVATALTAAAAMLVMLVRQDREKNGLLVADFEQGEASTSPEWADSDAVSLELAEQPSDVPAAPSSLDALGSTGGVAAAGTAARPPDGFSIGDVYTYLEQTPEGDVMVVKAVVVDVRRAAQQLQVLLSRIEIPTVAVAASNEYGRSFRGGATPALSPADATQDVALYVETDPGRMNAALSSLGDEDEFLSWSYAGVLDQSQPAAQQSALSYYGTVPTPSVAEPDTGDASLMRERERMAASGPRPAARGSVPDRGFRRAAENPADEREILPPTTARALPLRQQTQPAGRAGGAVEEKREGAEFADMTNGYQTILNVPRAELEQQLTLSNAASQSAEPLSRSLQEPVNEGGAADLDAKLEDATKAKQLAKEKAQDGQFADRVAQSQQQRRLRLLFVLEPEPMAGKAAKAKADQQRQAPVEAPPARKKG